MNLTMLEIHNSCERGLDECAALFEKADEKFTYCGGKQPGGSNLWIIEAAETGRFTRSCLETTFMLSRHLLLQLMSAP